MKILPLAKIAAAKKRLIERSKETTMPKIDVDSLWDSAGKLPGEHVQNFCRLIIEECAKQADEMAQLAENVGLPADAGILGKCTAAIRALKP